MKYKKKILKQAICFLLAAVTVIAAFGIMPAKVEAGNTATAYTNLQEVTSASQLRAYGAGKQYIVITSGSPFYGQTFAPTDCLLGIPTGAGLVQATSDGSIGSGASSSLTLAVSVGTPVIQGAGFDGCSGSFYNSSAPYTFYCSGGGVNDLASRIYTYNVDTYTDSDISVTLNSGVKIPTGAKTLTKSDITVKVRLHNTDYTVAEYSFTDAVVNYRAGDAQITINFGGVTKTLTVNTTGLGKKVWEEDNADTLALTTVNPSDKTDIQDAIDQGQGQPEVTPEDLEDLRNMLDAANFLEDNAPALELTSPNENDYNDLVKASSELDDLDPAAKAFINPAITTPGTGTLPLAMALAETARETARARQFMMTYLMGTNGIFYTKVTPKNSAQIINGEATWNALPANLKAMVDASMIASGSRPYEELLSRAKLGTAPQTGDSTNILPWSALLLISGATLINLIMQNRKYRYDAK